MAKEIKDVSSNPNAVEFERDKYGVTQQLKSVGLRTAGRVNGDKDKLITLCGVLDTLKAHAIARYKAQLAIKTEVTASSVARLAAAAKESELMRVKSLKIAQERVATLEAAAPKE